MGFPRPLSLPSSDKASEKAMLMPAPTATANPTRKVVWLFLVAKAVAKSGAREETEPSIKPSKPGWITCKINSRRSSFGVVSMIEISEKDRIFRRLFLSRRFQCRIYDPQLVQVSFVLGRVVVERSHLLPVFIHGRLVQKGRWRIFFGNK